MEKTANGAFKGLPDEYLKLFEQMMTLEERNNPDNNHKAKNILDWRRREEEKKEEGRPDFIRADFITPGSSGESTSEQSNSTFYVRAPDASPSPYEDENAPQVDKVNQNKVNATSGDDVANANQTGPPSTAGPPPPPPSTGEIGEATLRRKVGAKTGPRVTRNITEQEVMEQIEELCSNGHALDKYARDIELGSGAAGTVFLAYNKETEERVAIKIIDMVKQPKKEMILMELKV